VIELLAKGLDLLLDPKTSSQGLTTLEVSLEAPEAL
jgi:hypothetical protein